MENSNLVRLFISSTFSDFENERDALKERVFPKIHELCIRHHLQFQPIDLRWGVSETDALSQRTMSICLEEIKRCQDLSPQPNFLILLGDRYGWQPIPETIPAEEFEELLAHIDEQQLILVQKWYQQDKNALKACYVLRERGMDVDYSTWQHTEVQLRTTLRQAISQLDWTEEDPRRIKYFASATEQEIVSGLLEPVQAIGHVLCVMRSIRNFPTSFEDKGIRHVTDVHSQTNTPDLYAQTRLSQLKRIIEQTIPHNVLRYEAAWNHGLTTDHIDQMCADLYERLEAIILSRIEDRNQKKLPSDLEQEIENHNLYMHTQLEHFTGREDSLENIQKYLQDNHPIPLLVHGVSGTGKSALLAKASAEAEKQFPHAVIIHRFIGVTPASFDMGTLLASICKEIEKKYEVTRFIETEKDHPKDTQQWAERFKENLAYAVPDRPLLLFLDALNQLERHEQILALVKRVSFLPAHVRVILSSTPDLLPQLESVLPKNAFNQLREMKDKGEVLLDNWLKQDGRTLQPHQYNYILDRYRHCPLPLFLKLECEQSKHWRSWENVPDIVIDTENVPTVSDAIHSYLYQLEFRHGTLLTARALSYLVLSRYGLSEQELVDLLSRDEDVLREFRDRYPHSPKANVLPMNIYSSFYFDLRPYLTQLRHGQVLLLRFVHAQFIEIIQGRYFKQEKQCKDIREKLIAYYLETPDVISRLVEELPWLLSQNQEWEKLVSLLIDELFFIKAVSQNIYDVLRYWSEVEAHSSIRMKDVCIRLLENVSELDTWFLESYPTLLQMAGYSDLALSFLENWYEQLLDTGDDENLNQCLFNQGLIYKSRKELDRALEMFQKAEKIARKIGNKASVARALTQQGLIYKVRGELERALIISQEAEGIARQIGNIETLAAALNHQGVIYGASRNYSRSLELFQQAEWIAREIGDTVTIAESLNLQGSNHMTCGERDRALELFLQSEKIFRELGMKESISVSLTNQGLLYQAYGELDRALELFQQSERIAREIENKDGIAVQLYNLALIYDDLGELDRALELFQQAEWIERELGNKESISMLLTHQGAIYKKRGELDQALVLFQQAERFAREIENKAGIITTLDFQAGVYKARGELDRAHGEWNHALKMYQETERIAREIEDKRDIAFSLNHQGIIYHELGNLDRALVLFQEAERIDRKIVNYNGIALSLNQQGFIYYERRELDQALELFQEAESIARKIGIKEDIALPLNQQGIIYHELGKLDRALELFQQAESIARAIGKKEDIAHSLIHQGSIYHERGELEQALEIFQQAERNFREIGNKKGITISLNHQAKIFIKKKRFYQALSLKLKVFWISLNK